MRFCISCIIFTFCHVIMAQEHAWVFFKDKPNASSLLEKPEFILTERALDRRSQQNIQVNEQDVPLTPSYVVAIANATGVMVKARSKWLNALHVVGTQTAITSLLDFSFVEHIEFANKNIEVVTPAVTSKARTIEKLHSKLEYNYGRANNQITMLGVDAFHSVGFNGKGYQIAVIDGGFFGVNTAGAFGHLVDGDTGNGEILGGYDYVSQSSNFYVNTGSTHGTQVLSTMGAIKENEFVGTAPKASFYLFVTEDVARETPLEESLWVQAAEKADSLGVDILNTSLGYNQFDESKYNYTYEDMDGKTTFITRGAAIAAEKGMVVVNSAGNSGNNPWKYITAPADAANVIAVGAVNPNESITSFSSFGPTSDGRTKPETLAQGGGVYVVDENNTVKTSNGTSFSGPMIAGVVACLWQAFPTKTSLEIRQMIVENSKNYLSPTSQGGYGVLNVSNLLPSLSLSEDVTEPPLMFKIDEMNNTFSFLLLEDADGPLVVNVYSNTGNLVINKVITENNSQVSFDHLANGIYYLKYSYKNINKTIHLVKGVYAK